ncbi:MAG: efflux RND transporter periplasmic adaptor subunit [Clostridia bacterium]|nr:efflux RND transporter periplasmic adaptor subunit [Clostridia bacterium]
MSKKILAAIAAVSVAVCMAGCSQKEAVTEEASVGSISVSAFAAREDTVKNAVSYTGEIKATDSAQVAAQVSARVDAIYAQPGDYVEAGTVLLALDATSYQLVYNQALAAYNSALAGVESAKASQSSASGGQQKTMLALEQALSAAQSEYDNAKAEYERQKTLYDNDTNLVSAKNGRDTAKLNYERMQSLFDMGAVSQMELDNARIAYENASAAVTAAESSLQTGMDAARTRFETAERNLAAAKSNYELQKTVLNPDQDTTTQAAVNSASAGVASAKAALDIAANNLNNTKLVAPISGYVSMKNAVVGQMVGAGSVLFEIKNTNNVHIEIGVTESVVPEISVGTAAVVDVQAAGLYDMVGTVSEINPTKTAATGMYGVKLSVPNEEGKLKDGMIAGVALTTAESDVTVIIPARAVLYDTENQPYVYVISGETASKKDVVLGISDGSYVQITEGLAKGDRVVVSGKDFLSMDAENKVTVVSEEE